MGHVQLSDISLSFGDRRLLKNVTFSISSGDRFALTGMNGSGKSTLMKIIAGLQTPDSGTITKQTGTRISYLPQSGVVYHGKTLFEEADEAFNKLRSVEKEKERLEHCLSEDERNKEEKTQHEHTENVLKEQHRLQELLLSSGYYERAHTIRRVLYGLGFGEEDLETRCEVFSGGWQMRIALAKVLLERPDILLLDEPTNYLDIEARTWLESFLNLYPGGVLLVSHDRFFLDTVVTDVLDLFMGTIKRYRGNYTEYEKKYAEELAQLKKAYDEQQRQIEKTEEFIRRFRYNASKAKQVQSRIKELEKMERIELPENMKTIAFQFPPAPHSGRRVLSVDGLSRSYGENVVLNRIDFEVIRGERIAVTGKNGVGKSTLLRILAAEDTDYEGPVRYGTNVSVSYFAQDHENRLTDSNTVLEEVEQDAPTQLIPYLRDILGGFLFRGDDIEKKTSVLSGGEKSRLAIVKLLLNPVNLLILDEPTNHLDIHSKDILLYALRRFEGAVIFVSHDRYFLDQVSTKVLELTPKHHRTYPGDYEYYLWRKEKENGNNAEDSIDSDTAGRSSAENDTEGKLHHEKIKQKRNELQRLRRKEKQLLKHIEKLEHEAESLHAKLKDPSVYSDATKASETQEAIERNNREQERITQEWEEIDRILAQLETEEIRR